IQSRPCSRRGGFSVFGLCSLEAPIPRHERLQHRQDGNRIVIAGRDSAQDSINQVGQEITRRNMNIQPTLTERPGLPVRIIVNRDLVLRPYQPLFFNRGASQ
ncbi:TrbI/VirB10 family protein, partial [Pseudomonas aeruginosa]